jgi:hypothetical protein
MPIKMHSVFLVIAPLLSAVLFHPTQLENSIGLPNMRNSHAAL